MKKSSKIILTIVIIALIASVGGLGYYTITLNQKINDLEANKTNENDKDQKEEQSKYETMEKDKEITYTLFNSIYDILDYCQRDKDCIKDLGKFSLGKNTYDFKVNLYNDESEKESYILIENTKITLEGYLRYVVKVNNKLLIVQEFNGDTQAHINIYDENLNLVKTYITNSTSNNYFETYNNKFTYYKCDSDDFENQKLRKYTVTINEKSFDEKFESEKSIQCTFQE